MRVISVSPAESSDAAGTLNRRAKLGCGRLFAAACGVTMALGGPAALARADEPAEPTPAGAASERDVSSLLGARAFWARGKVMPGLAYGARFDFVQLDLEASLLWLTESAPPRGISFLGSELGAHVMFLPVRERYFDFGIGLGGDMYWLWNVHGDALEGALALKAAGHFWLTPDLGAYASARVYPLQSSGLELGGGAGADGAPVLFSTGITWRL